jgi:hypothetical protein
MPLAHPANRSRGVQLFAAAHVETSDTAAFLLGADYSPEVGTTGCGGRTHDLEGQKERGGSVHILIITYPQ